MAKGRSKGNKEVRKPKMPKPIAVAAVGTVNAAIAGALTPKKRKKG